MLPGTSVFVVAGGKVSFKWVATVWSLVPRFSLSVMLNPFFKTHLGWYVCVTFICEDQESLEVKFCGIEGMANRVTSCPAKVFVSFLLSSWCSSAFSAQQRLRRKVPLRRQPYGLISPVFHINRCFLFFCWCIAQFVSTNIISCLNFHPPSRERQNWRNFDRNKENPTTSSSLHSQTVNRLQNDLRGKFPHCVCFFTNDKIFSKCISNFKTFAHFRDDWKEMPSVGCAQRWVSFFDMNEYDNHFISNFRMTKI